MLDAYMQHEAREMRAALRELFPKGGRLWSPTGVYCYFDPHTHEILYVGLAKDLQSRFAQHNALIGKDARGNKREEIAAYFEDHELLGFSVYVQSAAVILLEVMGGETAAEIVGFGEGQLIRGHIEAFGRPPKWNRIEGSRMGAAQAGPFTRFHFGLLSGQIDALFVARRTIRQLANDFDAECHEQTLHSARLNAFMFGAFGSDGGVGDLDVLRWLTKLASEPQWGADPYDLRALADARYHLEPLPRLVRESGPRD